MHYLSGCPNTTSPKKPQPIQITAAWESWGTQVKVKTRGCSAPVRSLTATERKRFRAENKDLDVKVPCVLEGGLVKPASAGQVLL